MTKSADAKLMLRPLSELKPWSDNYNRGDVDAIRRSISRFGFNGRLAVWRDDVIVAGNHAWKALAAMRDAGEPPPTHVEARDHDWLVPVVDVTHLPTREEAYAYAIADNRTRDLAETDAEALVALLQQIADSDASLLDAVGHDADDLLTMLNELAGDQGSGVDAEPQIERASELREEWGTSPGQLWVLGQHRLIIGDATDPAVVARLMDGQRAVLFATDPPYLVDYDGSSHPTSVGGGGKRFGRKDTALRETYRDWDNPAQGDELYGEFVSVAIEHAVTIDAAWYCWHASRKQALLEAVWTERDVLAHQQIIWAKDRATLGRTWYRFQHEPCFFGWRRGHKPRRISDEYPSTVWSVPIPRLGAELGHPTSKPIELFEIPMRQHTRIGEVCYEPFSGSGTQIIAGERLDRRVFAAELAPEYAAVSLQRWADATGETPRREESAA